VASGPRPVAADEPLPSLVLAGVGRLVSWWRLELALAVPLVAGTWWLAASPWPILAPCLVVAVTVLLVAVRPVRRACRAALAKERARRRWYRGCHAAALPVFTKRTQPQVLRARPVPAGDLLDVLVPFGTAVADLEAGRDVLAAALHARDVTVARDPANARKARVLVARRDPLGDGLPLCWPHVDEQRLSVWEPIPVGVGDDGEAVTVNLIERNLLLGGEPGAGKSAALSLLIATAALDPDVTLWLLDGKRVELATWNGCARYTVGPDLSEALHVLRSLQIDMDRRYDELLTRRLRKVTRDFSLGLQVVVVDELAFYLNVGDRRARQEFAELLRDLVARGRAAGIIVLAATQKPSVDIIPSALRDLFAFRWAMSCSTPAASDTILGQGWASRGYSAAEIDTGHRGVGYLLHEGGTPVRCKAYYLDDLTLDVLARRSETLRGTHLDPVLVDEASGLPEVAQ
jgi:hypothetical protein